MPTYISSVHGQAACKAQTAYTGRCMGNCSMPLQTCTSQLYTSVVRSRSDARKLCHLPLPLDHLVHPPVLFLAELLLQIVTLYNLISQVLAIQIGELSLCSPSRQHTFFDESVHGISSQSQPYIRKRIGTWNNYQCIHVRLMHVPAQPPKVGLTFAHSEPKVNQKLHGPIQSEPDAGPEPCPKLAQSWPEVTLTSSQSPHPRPQHMYCLNSRHLYRQVTAQPLTYIEKDRGGQPLTCIDNAWSNLPCVLTVWTRTHAAQPLTCGRHRASADAIPYMVHGEARPSCKYGRHACMVRTQWCKHAWCKCGRHAL